jgi:hypothetical protein
MSSLDSFSIRPGIALSSPVGSFRRKPDRCRRMIAGALLIANRPVDTRIRQAASLAA